MVKAAQFDLARPIWLHPVFWAWCCVVVLAVGPASYWPEVIILTFYFMPVVTVLDIVVALAFCAVPVFGIWCAARAALSGRFGYATLNFLSAPVIGVSLALVSVCLADAVAVAVVGPRLVAASDAVKLGRPADRSSANFATADHASYLLGGFLTNTNYIVFDRNGQASALESGSTQQSLAWGAAAGMTGCDGGARHLWGKFWYVSVSC